jgi:hypothetical protein
VLPNRTACWYFFFRRTAKAKKGHSYGKEVDATGVVESSSTKRIARTM